MTASIAPISPITDNWLSLVSTVEKLSLCNSMAEIINVVRDTARRITGADGITFVLRDGELCHYVEENAIGPLWKGRRFPLTACISGWCMLNRQTAAIPDIYKDPRIPHDAYRPTFVGSLVMTPVRAEDPIAAIGAYWKERREFSDGEIAVIDSLARSTAAAIAAVKAHETVREGEERLRLALLAGGLGAWEFNLSTGAFIVSEQAKAHFGQGTDEAFDLEALAAAIHPEDAGKWEKAFASACAGVGADLCVEVRTVRPNGETRWLEVRGQIARDVNGGPVRLSGVTLDFTERKLAKDRFEKLQSDLAHVGRLSELGSMSAAFAHELTQPLTAAQFYLATAGNLLNADTTPSAKIQEFLGKAENQFAHATQIIQRIRSFASKGNSERAAQAVPPMIDEALEIALINPKYRGVEIHRSIPPDLPRVFVDKVQIQQVLLNLFRNAFEAMMEVEHQELDVSALLNQSGEMIELRVQDTGPGLSPEIASRLFEPFVTSKKNGMGIGLSICRQIVEAQGGRMWADLNSARGALFCITAPCSTLH